MTSEVTAPAAEQLTEEQLIARLKAARTATKTHEQSLMRSQATIDNINSQLEKTMSELEAQHGIKTEEELNAKIAELGSSLTTQLFNLETALAKF